MATLFITNIHKKIVETKLIFQALTVADVVLLVQTKTIKPLLQSSRWQYMLM